MNFDLNTLIVMLIGLSIICFTIYKLADRVMKHIEIINGTRKVDDDFSSLRVSIGGQDEEE